MEKKYSDQIMKSALIQATMVALGTNTALPAKMTLM
jgi:hypothetical protein